MSRNPFFFFWELPEEMTETLFWPQWTWRGIFPKIMYKWPIGICKGTQKSVIIRKMQIKTAVKYITLPPLSRCYKKNKQKTARDSEDVEKLESLYILLVRMQNGTAAVRNSTELPQKIKSRTIKWSSSPEFEYLSTRTEVRILRRYLHYYVHCSTIHDSQDVETI